MKIVAVVAGVIYNQEQSQVLLALRPAHKHQGNLWEFPGGKKEASESGETALARELQEELGIQVQVCEHFMSLDFNYPDKAVNLDIWQVSRFSGIPIGAEQQEIRWVPVADLGDYRFPAANTEIVKKLQRQLSRAAEPAADIADAIR